MSFPESQSADAPVLLPAQQEPLTADDAFKRFEENLDQQPDAADLVVVQSDPPPLGRSWVYDFHTRSFATSPAAHGPLETRGIATLVQWIEKCLLTARGAYPIYSENFGIDLPADFFGGPVTHFPDDLFRDRVVDALTKHPHIVDVTDMNVGFDPNEEYIAASFTVVTGTGDALNFQSVRVGG